MFKISGNPESWKCHILASVLLSSMNADGEYGARRSISGDCVSLKRCMQALVPLSSMEVDEVYDGRYSYA